MDSSVLVHYTPRNELGSKKKQQIAEIHRPVTVRSEVQPHDMPLTLYTIS